VEIVTEDQKNHILEKLEDLLSMLEEPSDIHVRCSIVRCRIKMIMELIKSIEKEKKD